MVVVSRREVIARASEAIGRVMPSVLSPKVGEAIQRAITRDNGRNGGLRNGSGVDFPPIMPPSPLVVLPQTFQVPWTYGDEERKGVAGIDPKWLAVGAIVLIGLAVWLGKK